MTPGARLQGVIELLHAIHEGTAPADRAIAAFFRTRRYVGAKDRRHVMDLAYSVMRVRARLDWWIAREIEQIEDKERARIIAHLALVDGWDADRIAGSFDGGQYRPARLTDSERRFAKVLSGKQLNDAGQPLSVRLEFPDWIEARLRARFGADLEMEMSAALLPASTDLRVNTLKASRDEAILALRRDGVEAVPTGLSPVGLRLSGRPALATLPSFRAGLIDVQDEGSQIVALLVGAKPGDRVVDFCAGAGGKALAIAAGMANKGRIVACDVLEGRVARAAVRLARAGVHNVERRGLTSERDQWVKRHARTFDRVLVDAPCTGIGTWRRNPDARWRLRPQDIDNLVDLQRRILDSAQRLAKPGGRLIYATCSLLPEENERQIEWFLEGHASFKVLSIADVWKDTIGGECPNSGTYLELTPGRNGTDGFFAAVLERAFEPAFAIRPAEMADAVAIAEIHFAGWQRAYAEFMKPEMLAAKAPERRVGQWREWIADPTKVTLVGVDGAGTVQGFVIGGPVLDHEFTKGDLAGFDCELYILHCRAEVEGQGLGKKLIAALARAFKARGCCAMALWAYRNNAYRGFYDRLGGRIVAEGLDEGDPDVAYGWMNLDWLIAQCELANRKPSKDKEPA